MNSRSITLPDFDIGFVKDFSKIIRLTNYGFTLNDEAPLAASLLTATLAASPSLAASPPTVNYIYCSSLDSNACCLTRNLESRLQFHPQPLARLATPPSTCLLLHLQHACRFALNRKPGVGVTRNREPRLYFTINRLTAASPATATSLQLYPLTAYCFTCNRNPVTAIIISAYPKHR